jgi:hypothetical protein
VTVREWTNITGRYCQQQSNDLHTTNDLNGMRRFGGIFSHLAVDEIVKLRTKLPDELQDDIVFNFFRSVLPKMYEFVQHRHRAVLREEIPTTKAYIFRDVIAALPMITFDKLEQDTWWAQTSLELEIKLNPRFPDFLLEANDNQLSAADKRIFLVQLAIAVMHELMHAYVRYPQARNLALRDYLRENGRSPTKLLDGVSCNDVGAALEYFVFGMNSFDYCKMALYAEAMNGTDFFTKTSKYVLNLVLFSLCRYENLHLGFDNNEVNNPNGELMLLSEKTVTELQNGTYQVCTPVLIRLRSLLRSTST